MKKHTGFILLKFSNQRLVQKNVQAVTGQSPVKAWLRQGSRSEDRSPRRAAQDVVKLSHRERYALFSVSFFSIRLVVYSLIPVCIYTVGAGGTWVSAVA